MANDDDFVIDSFNMADPELVGWDGTGGGPPDVPIGEYLFELTSLTVAPTNAGDGRNLVAVWTIVDGEYAGKEVRAWYLFQSSKGLKDGSKRRLAQVFRDALGVEMDAEGRWSTKSAIGRRMIANVDHEEQRKKGRYDAATQTTGPEKVFINAVLNSERPAPAETAPPPKAPTAPPPRPPTAQAPAAARNGTAQRTPPPAPPRR